MPPSTTSYSKSSLYEYVCSAAAIELVIQQTGLTTITCSGSYLSQLIMLKNQGKAKSVKFLISMDTYDFSHMEPFLSPLWMHPIYAQVT